jgi:MFS family permease
MYRDNIKWNYIFELIYNSNLTRALWPTYLVLKGFSLVEVGLCESVYHLSSMVFEMPTGVFADLWGRRNSRILGVLIKTGELLLLVYAKNIWLVLLAFSIGALGNTFESGANTAHVYDTLQETEDTASFSAIQGFREVLFQLSSLFSVVIGGYIANINYDYAYYLTALMMLISVSFLFKMREVPIERIKHDSSFQAIQYQFKTSWQAIKTDHSIMAIILFSSLFSSIATMIYFYISTYWQANGIGISLISIWLAFEAIGSMAGGLLVGWLLSHKLRRQVIFITPLISVIGCWLVGDLQWGVLGLGMLGFAESLLFVISNELINERITSQVRATVLSFSSMVFSITMIIIFPLFGYLAQLLSMVLAFSLLAVLTSGLYLVYLVTFRKYLTSTA